MGPAAHTAEQHGGRLLVCGDRVAVIEGAWKPTNLLIVEFPDADAMNSWVGSSDYAEMVELVSQSAVMSIVAVTSHSEVLVGALGEWRGGDRSGAVAGP